MEKQYSVQFFTSFVDGLQRTCQNYVTFGQMVEVSGYLSLEIDGVKKERYVLCELIQTTGNVISESYCTKVSRNCSTGLRPQEFRRHGNVSQVSPVARGNMPQLSSSGYRMSNTNTPVQSQPINRTGQGQQVNRSIPNPQGNRMGQKQPFARPAGISQRQSSQLNRSDNQSPQINPQMNRQQPSSSNSFQANQQNFSRLQVADGANRQTSTPRLNQSGSNKPDVQAVQQMPVNMSVTDHVRMVQENQSQSRQNNSPVPPVTQTNGRLDEQVDVMQTQSNMERNRGKESSIIVQGDPDVCVVAVTSGRGTLVDPSTQNHSAVTVKGSLSNRSASEGLKNDSNVVSQSAHSHAALKPIQDPPKQTHVKLCAIGVPQSSNQTRMKNMLQVQEPSSFQSSDPSSDYNSYQIQTADLPPMRRRDSVGSNGSSGSATPSLVVEIQAPQKIPGGKPVFLENQHQNPSMQTTNIVQSNTASFDNLMGKSGNNDNKIMPDHENESCSETSNSVGRKSKDNVSFYGREYPPEDYTPTPEGNPVCNKTLREQPVTGSCPSNPSTSHISVCMTNVPFFAPPCKRAYTVSPVPPVALSVSADENIPKLVPIATEILSKAGSSESTFQPTTAEQSHNLEPGQVKKMKLCTEGEKEDVTQSASLVCPSTSSTQSVTKKAKPAKRTAKKPKEKTEKKGKKGRRKSTKPKKTNPNDISSEEDNGDAAVPAANRTLRSARNPVKRFYQDDDYLSDGLTEFLLKETDSNNSQEPIKD